MKASTVLLSVATGLLMQCSTTLAASPGLSPDGWVIARSPHFEIYSQGGAARAGLTLTRFEELRACLDQTRVFDAAPEPQATHLVRVMEFATRQQYEAVQLRPTADAYYSAYADRGYIVMPIHANGDYRVPAHEYAHSVLHAAGLKLPPWLSEGIAEVFSTVTPAQERCELGGPIPGHLAVLARHAWLSSSELLSPGPVSGTNRAAAELFYAESWAVTDLLMLAPAYAPQFAQLVDRVNSGEAGASALTRLYGKSTQEILADARKWVRRNGPRGRTIPRLPPNTFAVEVRPLQELEVQTILADLLLTNGEWGRAESILKALLLRSPSDPDLLASLGTVMLRKSQPHDAVEYWRRAIYAGLNSSDLCYQFAQLADQMGLASAEVELSLNRAIRLRPDFDDARFKLALLKSNQSDYAAAVIQLQAMTGVSVERAFGYWSALSYALTEIGNRDEAKDAAEQAKQFSRDPREYASAVELAYQASTDLSVQFTRAADGKLQLTTARIPHGAAAPNPFIEAQDHIQVDSGYVQEVQCSNGKVSGFLIASTRGTVTLSVPDPTHILIKNGPSEFYCGSQTAVRVTAEYATTGKSDHGLLRGLEF